MTTSGPTSGNATGRAWRWEAIVVAVLFLAGALLGRNALEAQARAGRPPAFYQAWFAAAVYDTCGFGFTEPALERRPAALQDFLTLKSDSVSCHDLPADLPREPANPYAQMHRYLGASLTLLWRIRGIRWSAITPLFEVGAGLVAVLVYALFRLGMNRWWSMAGAIGIATSGLNLFYLRKLRDYAKAPFLLAALLILGWLVTRPSSSPRRLLMISSLFGAVIGIGFGFRTDVVVAVPLFLLTVVFFLPAPAPGWGARAGAIVIFVCSVMATNWSTLQTYSHGSNTVHVTLLGFTDLFAETLGLEQTDYAVNQIYGDRPIEAAARNYELLSQGGAGWASLTTARYDRLTSRYFWAVVRLVPADVVVRVYAAIVRVFESPFEAPGQEDCESLRPSFAGTACHARNLLLGPPQALRPVGLVAAAIVIVLTFAVRPRLGLFLAAVVAVFAGSTTLQFDPRHTFYLEFMPLWAMAFLAQRAGALKGVLVRWRNPDAPRPQAMTLETAGVRRAAVLRGGVAAVALVVIVGLVLALARVYQHRTLTTLFTRYLAAETVPLPIAWRDASTAILPLEDLLPPLDARLPITPDRPTIESAFLRIEVGGQACAGRSSYIAVRYEVPFNGALAQQAAARTWTIPPNGESVRLFIPVYRMLVAPPGSETPVGELRPLDVEMPSDMRPCLQSLARMRDASVFPIRLMTTLGPDWQMHRQYETLSSIGARNVAALP